MAAFCSSVLGCLYPADGKHVEQEKEREKSTHCANKRTKRTSLGRETHGIPLDGINATLGHWTELAVGSDPHLGVNLIVGYDLADEDVTREEVVVHRLVNDLSDRGVGEFDEGVVLGGAGLGRKRQM